MPAETMHGDRRDIPATLPGESVAAVMTPSVDVAVRLAPSRAAAVAAARSLAAVLADHPAVPVRVAGLEAVGSRVHITLALGLGDVADVSKGLGPGRAGLAAVAAVVESLKGYDAALVPMPRPESAEATAAREFLRREEPAIDQLLLVLA